LIPNLFFQIYVMIFEIKKIKIDVYFIQQIIYNIFSESLLAVKTALNQDIYTLEFLNLFINILSRKFSSSTLNVQGEPLTLIKK